MNDQSLISESVQLTESLTVEQPKGTGRLRVQIISPGWGSSGYYTKECIEDAVTSGKFPMGTHMYLDHPTRSEQAERPVRSVKDLAAVFEADAIKQPNGAAAVDILTMPEHRENLAALGETKAIGVSIRGDAVTHIGEAEGRRGTIIDKILDITSVDFVTHAGRGGKILEVMEAKLDESLNSSRSRQLADALQRAGVEDGWIEDYDDTERLVYYRRGLGMYEQQYTVSDDDLVVTLNGEPKEVAAVTTYVPTDPVGGDQLMESKEAKDMTETTPDMNSLLDAAKAERDEAVTQRDEAIAERDQLLAEKNEREVTEAARAIIGKAFTDAKVNSTTIMESIAPVMAEDGTLDEDKTRERAEAAAKELAALAPVQESGQVVGLGATASVTESKQGKIEESVRRAFGRSN